MGLGIRARAMKARTTSVLFAHSRLDAIPVLAGIAQLAFLLALYFGSSSPRSMLPHFGTN